MSTDHADLIIEHLLALSHQGRVQFAFPSSEHDAPATTEVSFSGSPEDPDDLMARINADPRMIDAIDVTCIVPSNIRNVYHVSADVLQPAVA